MSTFLLGLARAALPLLVLAFLLFVGFGYFSLASSFWPDLSAVVHLLLAALAGFFIFLMIAHTGKAFAGIDRERPITIAAALVSFLALFAFSGWGVVTSAMFLIEGPAIVREKADEMSVGMSRLDQTAKTRLPVPEFQQLHATVRDLETKLVEEINNRSGGRYCGVGPLALATLAQITSHLPTVGFIAGTGNAHDCADKARLRVIEDQYRESITNALNNHPLIAQHRLRERAALQKDIEAGVAENVSKLQNLAASSLEFRSNPRAYQLAFRILSQANSSYRSLVTRLNTLLGEDAGLPPEFDLAHVESISTGASVINAILGRLNRTMTWVILLGAVALDLIITLTVAAIYADVRRRSREREEAEARILIPGEDIRFLWLPPSQRWLRDGERLQPARSR